VTKQPNIASSGARPWVKLVLSPGVWILAIAVATVSALGYRWFVTRDAKRAPMAVVQNGSESGSVAGSGSSVPRLTVVHPQVGGVTKSTTQPGSVEAFNFENLFAKVSGYLRTQSVDIGDRVKKGQVLATIDAPEIVQAANQAKAELEQAQTQLTANAAALETAKADVAVARATVLERRADLKQAATFLEFRQIQYGRISDLFKQKAIDERAVDENRKERDSAEAAKNLAEAAIHTAEADLGAKEALVQQAQASVADARAKVQVASAVLEKAKVYVAYTQLHSQYNGVVTKRNFHVGDFVRAPAQGGQTPVLTVAETDLMRVVVKMPEDYVPLTKPGDRAVFKLNFADQVFEGKVSRIADSMDRDDKTMRTEIDIPNPNNVLRDGMFGYATIELSKSLSGLSVPASSLLRQGESQAPSVFVVRDGRLKRIPVKVTADTGLRAEILSGLRPDDLVVVRPGVEVAEGEAVQAVISKDGNPVSPKPGS
jgi:RND family efflux transporter MFP subunit